MLSNSNGTANVKTLLVSVKTLVLNYTYVYDCTLQCHFNILLINSWQLLIVSVVEVEKDELTPPMAAMNYEKK
jgi:hypothetical protein